jgi:hypothetical protein
MLKTKPTTDFARLTRKSLVECTRFHWRSLASDFDDRKSVTHITQLPPIAIDYNRRMPVPRIRRRLSAWNWLLVLPVLGLIFPALYARATPTLFGFPFFYWYQFAWIIVTGLITAIVYFATRSD